MLYLDEYRYDALGRRVLVRTRQEYACTTRCFNQLRRAIWDGDQLLYEIAAPGRSGEPPASMERDTGLAVNFKTGLYPTGRVEYVHGAELDAPLAMYRAEYSDSIGGGYYVPLANWKGTYDSGYTYEECYTREWSTTVAPPIGERQTGSDTTTSPRTSGTETLCPTVDWPAQYEWAARQYRRSYGGPNNWMGSLIYGQRDFSGLHYRRNRFYDSEQGRFTQEDPIGMAGGINLYGFANGDPVSYDDPFGLCPLCIPVGLAIIRAAPYVVGATKLAVEMLDPNPDVGTAIMSGGKIVMRAAGQAGRRAFGETAFRGLAQNRRLSDLTHSQIERAFESTPYTVGSHAISRLKDSRTGALGAETLNDIAALLNKGEVRNAGGGDVAVQLGRLEAIIDPATNRIETFRPYRPR